VFHTFVQTQNTQTVKKSLNLGPRNIAFVVFEWKMQDDSQKKCFGAREEGQGGGVAYLIHARRIRLDLGEGGTHRRQSLDQLLRLFPAATMRLVSSKSVHTMREIHD
jgi:hypothetical protein